jgi:hypothetical protein
LFCIYAGMVVAVADVNLLRKIIFAFPPWEGTYSGDVLMQ